MPTLVMRSLSLRSSGVTRVDAVSAEVRSGECVVIQGANGSGKSSLLEVMAGLAPPTSGTVELDGYSLTSFTPRNLARQRAWLGQRNLGGDSYLVRDVIGWGTKDVTRRRGRSSSADQVAAGFGLADLVDVPLGRLSGGERQRVHLARIWLQDAPVTMLDEPDTGVDADGRSLLQRMISDKTMHGHSVVLVTHNREWAHQLADQLWVMDQGRLIEQ